MTGEAWRGSPFDQAKHCYRDAERVPHKAIVLAAANAVPLDGDAATTVTTTATLPPTPEMRRAHWYYPGHGSPRMAGCYTTFEPRAGRDRNASSGSGSGSIDGDGGDAQRRAEAALVALLGGAASSIFGGFTRGGCALLGT